MGDFTSIEGTKSSYLIVVEKSQTRYKIAPAGSLLEQFQSINWLFQLLGRHQLFRQFLDFFTWHAAAEQEAGPIRDADQVLVINHGEIIERGSHESLLEQQGFYHHLYMSQFKGQEI